MLCAEGLANRVSCFSGDAGKSEDAIYAKYELRSLFPAFVPLPTQWRRDKQGFRWVYSRFLRHNRSQVLELIAGSSILPKRVDADRLLDRARSDDSCLSSSLVERMLCIAGLEQTMGLGAAETTAATVE